MARHTLLTAIALIALAATDANAQVPSLCTQAENTVWSGTAHAKIYSVCASKNLTSTTGYLQYRAGKPGKVEFKYPATLVAPRGHFVFLELAHGAQLTFKHGAYDYTITDPLAGQSEIDVSKGTRALANIVMQQSTLSLTENTTINLFQAAGISE